jgi:TRAP-type C4-dicarboxylate transport system substrate-binding protein
MLRALAPLWAVIFLQLLGNACAEPLELKLGHAGGPNSIQAIAAGEFAKRFNQELGQAASIGAYGNSVLGTDSELLNKVKTGEVPLAIFAAPMSSVADEFGIFDMPFLIKGRRHLRLFRDQLLERYLEPAALAKGYRILGMWEFGVRHVTNNIWPIQVPADLAGLRFRTPKAKWRTRMLESYGAQVTTSEIRDVYASIQSGSIDGLEMPLPVFCSLNVHEVQKYLSLTKHLYSPAFLVIAESEFQKLPAKVRGALAGHAHSIQDWVLERGEELDESWLKRVRETMIINEAERFTFTLKALPIYRQFIAEVPNARPMMKLIFDTDPNPYSTWE